MAETENSRAADDAPRMGNRALSLALLLGFAVRVVWVIYGWSSGPVFEKYFLLADKLKAVGWLPGEAFASSPLYIYIIGVLHGLLGLGEPEVRLFQAVVGTAAILFAWHGANRLCGRFAANVSAFILALYPACILYDTQPLAFVWVDMLNAAALWMIVKGRDEGRLWCAVVTGAALGLSALMRPNVFLWVPFVLLWLVLTGRIFRGWRVRLALGALLVAAAAVAVLPIALLNARADGGFMLVTGSGGSSLYGGNNPNASGVMFRAPPGNVRAQITIDPRTLKQPITPEHWAFRRMAEWAEGRRLSARGASEFYTREAKAWARREPERFREILWNKFRHFFAAWEVHDTASAYVRGEILAQPMRVAFIVVWPLGMAGMVLCLGRWRRVLAVYGLFATYLATALVFYVTSRLRLPVVLPIAIFAGAGLSRAIQAARRRKWGRLVLLLLVAIPCGVAFARPTPLLEQIRRQQRATHDYLRPGAELLAAGPKRVPEALRLLNRAVRTDGNLLPRALWYLQPYMRNPAVRRFATELQHRPPWQDPFQTPTEKRINELSAEGFALFVKRRYALAAEKFGEAIKLRPGWYWPYYNRAQCEMRLKKWKEALADLRKAFDLGMKLEPDIERLYYDMAFCALQSGRPAEANESVRRSLFVSPRFGPALALEKRLAAPAGKAPARRK